MKVECKERFVLIKYYEGTAHISLLLLLVVKE